MANKHEKICSTLLFIRKMQITTTMRYNFTLTKMGIMKKTVKNKCWKRSFYTAGKNIN